MRNVADLLSEATELHKMDVQMLRVELQNVKKQLRETEEQWNEEHERSEELEAELRVANDELRRLLGRQEKRTCPEPGGCEECPNPTWCTVIRINSALTTPPEELRWLANNGQRGVFDAKFLCRHDVAKAPDEVR